ncbi:MAG TPA: plastocyanin [Candidatus Blackburnbacteria bacterium]|nr:plastocyanin [Candidatus Blackburnbacteria bacterium]
MQKKLAVVVIILLLIIAVVLLYNSRGKSNVFVLPQASTAVSSPSPVTVAPSSTSLPSSSSSTQTSQVSIKNFAYSPATITVKVGTTITWKNEDSALHTVTSDDTSGPLDSDQLATGDTYSETFYTVGQFSYHCDPHSNMKAAIIVTN